MNRGVTSIPRDQQKRSDVQQERLRACVDAAFRVHERSLQVFGLEQVVDAPHAGLTKHSKFVRRYGGRGPGPVAVH